MYLTKCPFSFAWFVMPPQETLHPRDPSGRVFYLWIVLSPKETSRLCVFLNVLFFTGRSFYRLVQPPSWRTTPCRLSATAYSIYLQLPSISEAVPPSATWEVCITNCDQASDICWQSIQVILKLIPWNMQLPVFSASVLHLIQHCTWIQYCTVI